jgi:hypothetical protein
MIRRPAAFSDATVDVAAQQATHVRKTTAVLIDDIVCIEHRR